MYRSEQLYQRGDTTRYNFPKINLMLESRSYFSTTVKGKSFSNKS
jgi:hypothetical protein